MKPTTLAINMIAVLATVLPTVFGATPTIALSSSNLNPAPGETVTITGVCTDPDGDLARAALKVWGTSDPDTFIGPIQYDAEFSLSGGSDTFTWNYTVPTDYNGPWLIRGEVYDSVPRSPTGIDDVILDIGANTPNDPPITIFTIDPVVGPNFVAKEFEMSWIDIDGFVALIVLVDQFGNPMLAGAPLSSTGTVTDFWFVSGQWVFIFSATDNDGDTTVAPTFAVGY